MPDAVSSRIMRAAAGAGADPGCFAAAGGGDYAIIDIPDKRPFVSAGKGMRLQKACAFAYGARNQRPFVGDRGHMLYQVEKRILTKPAGKIQNQHILRHMWLKCHFYMMNSTPVSATLRKSNKASKNDLWFLPRPVEEQPDYLPPGPMAEPRETAVLGE